MLVLIGGNELQGSAGANRTFIDFEVIDLPEGRGPWPGGLRLKKHGGYCRAHYDPTPCDDIFVVITHHGPAGSWHGAGIAQLSRCVEPYPVPPLWEAVSLSGGAALYAGIYKLQPDQPLDVLTSGYDGRRNWTVRTVYGDGAVVHRWIDEWAAERS